ncbi:hypothetical protein SALBM135S_00024 [Streptomyces alboniger]
MDELQEAADRALARFTGAEAKGTVVHCTASAITLAVAAAMTGESPERVEALPDTTGMPGAVVLPTGHAVNYGHPIVQAVRLAGAVPVLVGTDAGPASYWTDTASAGWSGSAPARSGWHRAREAWRRDTRPCWSPCWWSAWDTAPSSRVGVSRWRPGSTRHSAASPWVSGRPGCRWGRRSPRPYSPSSPRNSAGGPQLVTGGFVALLGAGLFMGCYRRPPDTARPARQGTVGPAGPGTAGPPEQGTVEPAEQGTVGPAHGTAPRPAAHAP